MIIDAFAFCRNGEREGGKFSLNALPRLRAECASGEGQVAWQLTGSTHNTGGATGHPQLTLVVDGTVQLMCQRCMTPYDFQIQSTSTMLLATDEKSADQIDATLEDDVLEVIVGSKTFDINNLIEDEALLAIPLSPKHEVCPKERPIVEKLDAFAKVKKESPFAALKDQIKFGSARDGKTKN